MSILFKKKLKVLFNLIDQFCTIQHKLTCTFSYQVILLTQAFNHKLSASVWHI